VTGYAVALPGDTSRDGSPVWYGGAKLARPVLAQAQPAVDRSRTVSAPGCGRAADTC